MSMGNPARPLEGTSPPNAALPLQGVVVLELAQIMAGPTCGLMLADLGATVIKVEKFPGGDDSRAYKEPRDRGVSAPFLILNRGKRSLAIDLKHPEGKATLKRLVAKADVLTENFRLGTMEKLGLGYEQLKAVNPGLIYCAVTGYGRTGPWADKGGFDLVAQGFAGLMSITGERGGPPAKPGNSVGDINGGILAAFGILSAYIHRLKTGQGALVDTSLMEASIQQTYWFAAMYFGAGQVGQAAGSAHPLTAPYQAFECSDGYVNVGGANQNNWERIADTLGHPEWKADARFVDNTARMANLPALVAAMNAVMRQHPRAHWLAAFDAAGVPAGPIHNMAEALEHPQTLARGMTIEVAHPAGGTTRAIGSPIKFNGASLPATTAAPALGQHTREVLAEFGFGTEEIEGLVAGGAVMQA